MTRVTPLGFERLPPLVNPMGLAPPHAAPVGSPEQPEATKPVAGSTARGRRDARESVAWPSPRRAAIRRPQTHTPRPLGPGAGSIVFSPETARAIFDLLAPPPGREN